MKAIVVSRPGGPEVLELDHRAESAPGPGQVQIDVAHIGVNFFDTGIRAHQLTDVPGMEGSGTVKAVGADVTRFAAGDRVAWLTIDEHGSYAQQVTVSEDLVVPVPDAVDLESAAAVLLQGLTAHHFATVCHPVEPGDTVVIHAAAGGVGLMLTQLVKARGGNVIGLVSRQEKVEIAARAGADHVLVSDGGAFVEPVMKLTDGAGVRAVYDGAGGPTFAASLDVLQPHGRMVFFGPLIGDVPTIKVNEIPRSISIAYGTLPDHIPNAAELTAKAADLFALVASGALEVRIGGRYELADAAQAHIDLESRGTTGKLLLIP